MRLRRFGRRRWIAAALLFLTAFGAGQLALSASIEVARERWTTMAPAEREQIADRWQQFRELDDGERRALVRRARRLSALQEELVLELPEESRAKLENLDPHQRMRLLREMLEDELKDRGRRVKESLPPEFAEQLETVQPAERRELLRDFDRGGRRARIATMARDLDRDVDVSNLDDDELDACLHELRRALIERRVEDHGLPRGLSVDAWGEMEGLDDAGFARTWNRAMRQRSEPTDAETARRNPFERLRRALRPDPAWHVENAHLSPEERRAAIHALLKRRCLNMLESIATVEPDEIERLRSLDGPAFIDAVRDVARQLHQRAERDR